MEHAKHFVAMVVNPDMLAASIRSTERTQEWLDAIWNSALKNKRSQAARSFKGRLPIPSINGQGTVPIQRVAGDNIALCELLSTHHDVP